jgi:manganese transport protein
VNVLTRLPPPGEQADPLPLTGPSELETARAKGRARYTLALLGPAFVACVAYVDPGNFATNIAGGAKYGYTLVWVIVAANLMAMLIQTLSAKLGIATGRNLPEVCREQFSRRTSFALWVQAEVIAMATDLAEFLGAALGFHLLLGIDLFPAAILTGVVAFLILGLLLFFRGLLQMWMRPMSIVFENAMRLVMPYVVPSPWTSTF